MSAVNNARILLRASLDKIENRESLEESVEDAVEVLMQVSNAADNTLLFIRDRPDGEYLRNQLEYDDILNIGHYKLSRQKKKDLHKVTFAKPECTITFTFKRRQYSMEEKLLDMVRRGPETTEEDMKYITAATIRDSLSDNMGHTMQEDLLGANARTLDTYALDKVDVITPAPRRIGNWAVPLLKTTMTETVYQTPE